VGFYRLRVTNVPIISYIDTEEVNVMYLRMAQLLLPQLIYTIYIYLRFSAHHMYIVHICVRSLTERCDSRVRSEEVSTLNPAA